MDFTSFIRFLVCVHLWLGCSAEESCPPRQTVQLAAAATIQCSFPRPYFGVYWYYTQDITKQPFIYKEEELKAGSGFTSQEFDVAENGSLVIANVTIEHERIFTVVFLESDNSRPVRHTIEVDVYGCSVEESCPPRQTVQLAAAATIQCSFPRPYFGVYWYYTQDTTKQPFIYKEEELKTGSGFTSQEFDVAENGSLVIANVTIEHKRIFTVVFLESDNSRPVRHTIEVDVYARPPYPFPVIDMCNHKRYCYATMEPNDTLKCSVSDAKPTVELSWMLKTVNGDKHQPMIETYSSNGHLNTSLSTMVLQEHQSLHLYLFVCKAESSHLTLDHEFSFIAVEMFQPKVNLTQITSVGKESGATLTLLCSGNEVHFVVWKKVFNETDYEVLAHGYVTVGLREVLQQPYALNHDGSLVVPHLRDDLEGVYVCISTNGVEERTSRYSVTVLGADNTGINQRASNETKNLLVFGLLSCVVLVAILISVLILIFKVIGSRRRTNNKNVEEDALPELERLHSTKTENEIENQSVNEKDDMPKEYLPHRKGKSYIKIRTYTIGKQSDQRAEKVILLIGDNNIESTILDLHILKHFAVVARKNDLISKAEEHERMEYGLIHEVCYVKTGQSSVLPFDITVIILSIEEDDVTAAIRFEEITEQMKYLATHSDAYNLKKIDGIVLVQDGTHLESFPHKDISHPILRIFGSDLLNKVSFIGYEALSSSLALDVKGKYSCVDQFSLDRKVSEDGDCTVFLHKSDETGFIDLQKSIEVWERRTQLTKYVPIFCTNLGKYIANLETLRRDIVVKLKNGEMAMNCEKCKYTCHYPCNHDGVMPCCSWDAYMTSCTKCANHCDASIHARNPYRYKTKEEKKARTAAQSKELAKVTQESKELFDAVKGDAVEINKCLQELRHLAIQPTLLSFKEDHGVVNVTEILDAKIKFENFKAWFTSLCLRRELPITNDIWG